jgi:hypothetical protein
MDARFDTVIRRFGISKGVVLEHPQNVSVTEAAAAPGLRRGRGSLYVLIEVLGGLPDPAYTVARLAEVIHDQYYQATGSITGAIGAGLRAANEWLFEENLNSQRERRGVAGVICAVLRGGDLYLGQIGPSLAYLLQVDGLRRFPEDSPWLRQPIPSDEERAASPPLGVRRVIAPQFYHATVDAGDVFMLASPIVARLAAGELIADALGQDPDLAREKLLALAYDREVNVLIATLQARPMPAAVPPPEPARPGEVAEPAPGRSPGRLGPLRTSVPGLDRAWQALGQLLHSTGLGLAGFLRRLLPRSAPRGRAGRPRAPGRPQGRSSARVLALLALLVPVLVIAIVLATRYQYEQLRRAQVADLLRQAGEARLRALVVAHRSAQREALEQTIALVDEALALAPDEPTALALRQQALDELDAASNVQRLYTIWHLADLGTEYTGSLEPARIVVHGSDIFVLDRVDHRLHYRLLNPAGDALEVPGPEAPLVQRGEYHGAITVGDLVDMVWMPPGGERTAANLVIVERNGSLLDWDPARGLQVLPIADSAGWRKPQAIGGFAGHLYLLDAQQNRIMKYAPTADGYTSPPVDYFATPGEVDLTAAVDMAIDGRIYVLLADGTILKFLAGQPQPFRIADLDVPLRNPVAMFVTGEDDARGYVYVADAGLARVVQFTKQGEFVRQFRAAEGHTQLDHVRGLFVDEATQRMYLVSGPTLYMAPLSQVPRPTQTATPASPSSSR